MASGYKSIPSQTVAASFISTNTFRQMTDFANIFKAFIGTNWLAIPFAFKQSGLLLGIAGVVLIALVTDHCCQLIIKCKTAAVKLTVEKMHKEENVDMDTEDLREFQDKVERKIMYGDIGRITLGKWGLAMVNCALLITQFFFCTGYFIFLGNTIASLFPIKAHQISENSSIPHHNHSANRAIFLGDECDGEKTTAPAFPLLLLIPLFPLILMAFIRNVRKLGPISFLANIALLVAFLSVISYMLNGLHNFKFSELKMAQWATFPVFFGQVTSAYEGIGTIIPIETSMAENRRRFPFYLHLTIALLSLVLGGFGILGYFVYGDHVAQIVTENMTSGVLSLMVRVLLCLAILFTYPLQLFPVVRIIESWLFPNPKESVHAKSVLDRGSPDVLMPYDEEQVETISTLNDTTHLLKSQTDVKTGRSRIRTWKKNALRTLLVISSAAIAIALKDNFAYLNAITGAIGSSMLAFILPCIFHLVLFKQTIHPLVVLKDVLIILFGVVGGLVGLYVVIEQLVKQFS